MIAFPGSSISATCWAAPGRAFRRPAAAVALARALIRKPDVLLLDEPLANLDAKLRLEMRSEIRRLQRETGITAILVTHDQVEAMSMCDRIAIMKEGEIVQIATPAEMYTDPKTAFVAGFLGNPPITFLRGVVDNGAFVIPRSEFRVPLPASSCRRRHEADARRPAGAFYAGGDVAVPGKVTFAETQGRENLYDVALAGGAAAALDPAGAQRCPCWRRGPLGDRQPRRVHASTIMAGGSDVPRFLGIFRTLWLARARAGFPSASAIAAPAAMNARTRSPPSAAPAELGAEMWELDTQLSRDGIVMVRVAVRAKTLRTGPGTVPAGHGHGRHG